MDDSALGSDSTDLLTQQTTKRVFRVFFVIDSLKKLAASGGKTLTKERCLAIAEKFTERDFSENAPIEFQNTSSSFTLCLVRRGACEVK